MQTRRHLRPQKQCTPEKKVQANEEVIRLTGIRFCTFGIRKCRYPCKLKSCNHRFVTWSGMLAHRETHRKGHHKCTQCNRVFTWLSSLKEHKVLHSKTRKFKCAKCGKVYKQKYELKRHCTKHGWKSFVCNTCSFKTWYENVMQDHQKTQHGKPRYCCDKCEKMFKFRMQCLYHIAVCTA